MINNSFVEKKISLLKKAITKSSVKQDLESRLVIVERLAYLEYVTNYQFRDDYLENEVASLNGLFSNSFGVHEEQSLKKPIVFYDGFGLSNRGLAHIYLKALVRIREVAYIYHKSNAKSAKELIDVVKDSGGIIYEIDNSSRVSIVEGTKSFVAKIKPLCIFFYSTPNDITGLLSVAFFKDTKKFFINLTDHAFWLGSSLFDYYIDFRDYGASINHFYRSIPVEKELLLPYYPDIRNSYRFEGFPFKTFDNSKIIFSGGDLYKTISPNLYYYKAVKHILQHDESTIFWYAGKGNSKELNRLKRLYPNRVFYTCERKDLFQVMQNCYFYLNTYPLGGGLMMQYAAIANKIPLTLCDNNSIDGIFLHQDKLDIVFKDYDLFIREIDRCLDDPNHLAKKEKNILNAVIQEEQFNECVREIVTDYKTCFETDICKVETSLMKSSFLLRLKKINVESILIEKKDFLKCFRYYPFQALKSLFAVFLKRLFK